MKNFWNNNRKQKIQLKKKDKNLVRHVNQEVTWKHWTHWKHFESCFWTLLGRPRAAFSLEGIFSYDWDSRTSPDGLRFLRFAISSGNRNNFWLCVIPRNYFLILSVVLSSLPSLALLSCRWDGAPCRSPEPVLGSLPCPELCPGSSGHQMPTSISS